MQKDKAKAKPYNNFKAELLRAGFTQKDVAEFLGVSVVNINAKLNGRVVFTVPEVLKIRDEFMPDATLDYLLAVKD